MDIKTHAAQARATAKTAISTGALTLPEGVRWSIRRNTTHNGLEFVLRGLDRTSFYKSREQLEREGTSRRMLTEEGNALVVAITELFANTGTPAAEYDPYADYQDNGWGRVSVYAFTTDDEYGRDVSPNWP